VFDVKWISHEIASMTTVICLTRKCALDTNNFETNEALPMASQPGVLT
jgi:hypothetical protein